ncbi:unnamed protein product [Rotaria socialis]
MKIPPDDTVEIVSFDLAEQLKMLINKNIDLLKKYQDEPRTQITSDANDIVRGDVYQSILRIEKDSFVSVMIHSDGIPLYRSKNCNAWPILGAVLELPPYSRNRADNTLLLALWIGKKPNFSIIFEKFSERLFHLKNKGTDVGAGQGSKCSSGGKGRIKIRFDEYRFYDTRPIYYYRVGCTRKIVAEVEQYTNRSSFNDTDYNFLFNNCQDYVNACIEFLAIEQPVKEPGKYVGRETSGNKMYDAIAANHPAEITLN